jgi:hypothetical protein
MDGNLASFYPRVYRRHILSDHADKINDVEVDCVVDDVSFSPVLACQDRHVRVLHVCSILSYLNAIE